MTAEKSLNPIINTAIDGDVGIGRNISAGGDASIQGSALIKGDTTVEGWLIAPNVVSSYKGYYKDETQLTQTIPYPKNGWWAFSGDTLYVVHKGEWRPASGTFTDGNLQQFKDTFLSKRKPDTAHGHLTLEKGTTSLELTELKKGATFGEFKEGIHSGMGGRIDERGNAELESLKVRSSLEVLELIVNRLSAYEGDVLFTESDTIEKVDDLGNNCYGLHLKRKWEGYFTAQAQGNILKGIYNTLGQGNGQMYTSWMRVNSANTANNYIEVSLYPDSEVPAKKNYPPTELMKVARWGNQTDENRQECFYISSTEGRLVKLTGVNKPILEDCNYGATFGTLPEFVRAIVDDRGNPLPLHSGIDYMYIPGIVVRDVVQIDRWTNKPISTIVDRGTFVLGEDYYCDGTNPKTQKYETSDVWHYGCKFRCCKNLTRLVPKWNITDWAMIEGNPEFSVDFEETDAIFDPDTFNTKLSIVAKMYNQDVTPEILPQDVQWTRYSEDDKGNERINEDASWNIKHAGAGKVLHLTRDDCDFLGYIPKVLRFIATVTLRDGMGAPADTQSIAFEF